MLKQADIFKSIIVLLNQLNLKIYTDEVIENYKAPCLFLKLIKTYMPQSKNTNSNNLTIVITYMPNKYVSQQIQFLELQDKINDLFKHGIYINKDAKDKRYLHINNITYDVIGEDNDILQATIDIDYIDTMDYDKDFDYEINEKYYLMENIKTKIN